MEYEAGIFVFKEFFTSGPFDFTTILQSYTDDPDSLQSAIDLVGNDAGTPTHNSLLEVLAYSEQEKPTVDFDRAIVLLSDGESGDSGLLDDVCARADSMDSPIYTIGLGPANQTNSGGRNQMENLANCDGFDVRGAFAGLAAGDSLAADSIYTNIARATGEGSLTIEVQLENYEEINVGDNVRGTLTLRSGGREASAPFMFERSGTRRGAAGPADLRGHCGLIVLPPHPKPKAPTL